MLSWDAVEGLLLVGHGTRASRGNTGFLQVAGSVAVRMGAVPVEPCFLEMARPSIAEGVERLVRGGVRRITVMPLLLAAAGHVRRDIPTAVAVAAAGYSGIEVRHTAHLGRHPRVVELSTIRYEEALRRRPPVDPAETLLVLVGRGSRDPRATRETHDFAQLRWKRTPVGGLEVGFLAMASPPLEAVLARAAARRARRIVLQPHLLFPGALAAQTRGSAQAAARDFPAIDWVVAEPLGPHPLLAEAVCDIVARAPAWCEPAGAAQRRG